MTENSFLGRLATPLVAVFTLLLGAVAMTSSIHLLEENREPKSGVIVSLNHEPEYEVSSPRCTMRNNIGVCVDETLETQHYPATWTVIYEDEAGNMGDNAVTEEQYEVYNVGDYYVNDN